MPIKKTVKTLRVAIVGCGGFGSFHAENLMKMENVEITALYNRGIEKLEKLGKKLPRARMYQDFAQMLSKEKLDAAIISLTPDAHGEIEELCCKKKIHMYIEKPIERSYSRAQKIAEAVKFSGVITSVGYQERYSPCLELVKEIVAKEPVGLVNASWIGGMPGPQWWRTKAQSGGQVVEQTTHMVDMLRYLFGEVDRVFAGGRCDARMDGLDHDVEDYSAGVLQFDSGVIASLQSGCYAKNSGAEQVGFQLFTPRCQIDYRWGKSLTVTSGERSESVNITGDNHIPSIEAFVAAVRSGDRYEIKSPYEDALESLKVTLMLNRSMDSGEPVKGEDFKD